MNGRRGEIAAKIAQNVKIDPETQCAIWQGGTSGKGRGGGYGRMKISGATVAVHRAQWINENGIIPPRKQVDHKCRNRLCVNPDHLELVTPKQNAKRRDAANAQATPKGGKP